MTISDCIGPSNLVNDGGAGNARPYYNGYYSDREGNQKAANHVVMLRNTSKGHSLYTTFQLQKNFVDGILKGLVFEWILLFRAV